MKMCNVNVNCEIFICVLFHFNVEVWVGRQTYMGGRYILQLAEIIYLFVFIIGKMEVLEQDNLS